MRRLTTALFRQPLAILLVTLILVVWAVSSLSGWRLDTLPDVASVQVQVLIPLTSLAPEEAEQSVTRLLELELAGLPGLVESRSITCFGLSQITLTFADGFDLFRARQFVQEKIATVQPRLPPGLAPRLGPPTSPLGEVYTYVLRLRDGERAGETIEQRLTYLKSVHDFVVRPLLRTVPGVAEVNATGGFEKQILVTPDLDKLYRMAMDLADVAQGVARNVEFGSAALVDATTNQKIVRTRARAQTLTEIANTSLKLTWGSLNVRVRDIAKVEEGVGVRTGAATWNGEEAVLGTALALAGTSSNEVARAVHQKIKQLPLPHDVEAIGLYNRANLVTQVLRTVGTNLSIGVILVVIVLFGFFRSARAALITASVIPLSFLLAIAGLSHLGISGNLLSLGAIDFGLIVDAAVVVTDSYLVHLRSAETQRGRLLAWAERRKIAARSTSDVVRPLIVGWIIILSVYLPVFALTGVEAKLFRPLAIASLLALLAAFPVSLTLVPSVVAAWIGRSPVRWGLGHTWTNAYLHRLRRIGRHRVVWLASAVALLGIVGWWGTRIGSDLVQNLDEGSTVLEINKDPSINLSASVSDEIKAEKLIRKAFPEVATMYSKIGFSEIATDAQGPNENDLYLFYQPRNRWRLEDGHRISRPELEHQMIALLRREFPGQDFNVNQPVRVRIDEMLEGVKADLTVKLFGPDIDQLDRAAQEVKSLIGALPGAGEVTLEPVGRIPFAELVPERETMARYLISALEIDQSVEIGLAGRTVGRVEDGEKFYPIVVRLGEAQRKDPKSLLALPIRSLEGTIMLVFGQIGVIQEAQKINQIFHQDGFRRRVVLVEYQGKDLQGFGQLIKDRLAKLPVRWELGGTYRRLQTAQIAFGWATPLLLCAAFWLMTILLRSWRLALVVLSSVPLALIGGVVSLAISGLPYTVPATLGLVAVGGIALMNKLVFVDLFQKLRRAGFGVWPAIEQATRQRLRPVISTALVAGLGFLPMVLSRGTGAEVQRSLGVVVVGGLGSSTILTLILLPLLLTFFTGGQKTPIRSERLVDGVKR